MYRVKEIVVTPTYSEFEIERKFLWFWIPVRVPEQYSCTLKEALKWVKLKDRGFNPDKYYYE